MIYLFPFVFYIFERVMYLHELEFDATQVPGYYSCEFHTSLTDSLTPKTLLILLEVISASF
jgi:hypothetical protein